MSLVESEAKVMSAKKSRTRPATVTSGSGAWLPLRAGASGMPGGADKGGPGERGAFVRKTREEALAHPKSNPRLKAATSHTWSWQPSGGDEELPSIASLAPFQAVLQPPEDKSRKELAGLVAKSPLTPARCRSSHGGPINKGLDSLLLSTVMEQHHEHLSEMMVDPSPRARAKRHANASPSFRDTQSVTYAARSHSVMAHLGNHRSLDEPAHTADWQSRPANVDIANLQGKIPPLGGEYNPAPRSESVVPSEPSDNKLGSNNALGAAVHEWGPVGTFQWAPAPSRFQAWRRVKESLEPGCKAYRKQLEELQRVDMLVRSFKRAANPSTIAAEGRAHYRAGIIFDNLDQYGKAVERYEQFLASAKQLGDVEGVAVAHNCIAVAHQRDADAQANGSPVEDDDEDEEEESVRVSTSAQMHYEKALENHLKHLEVADTAGQLVAHTNLGLMSTMLGQKEAAAYSHEQAIKCAVQLQDQPAERASVGNLAFLLLGEERYEESRPFLERYVSVCCALNDGKGQAEGYLGLGRCARALHELRQAADAFESALRAAQDSGDQSLFNEAKVLLGIARGELKYVEMTSNKQLPLGYQQATFQGFH
mmetsp:Transcript_9702/g.11246  ORF Transcript_9702/g.11246 Transcript_9702/m.11246 type:complete len:595 (-) Transcript_9702:577-2361(-)|eukprot:CAMPEP_0197867306 /NCGR_PEP_ID=MMETSP1438-20131217/44683_1 /TAXON_ID=1461541 /ORGANISM="Pterosperma sp., Strain CCMP1384" /LENGTH=594 /DNA_ID=CAMNT_0043485945 /DNA_START=457 /DNA_END=2241 /DNA_ORIENTATION=-